VLGIATMRHDARAALRRIAAPTLVLSGACDPIITAARQRRDFADLRDVTFHVIEGAGHAIALERPAEVAARVLAFVADD
jgi:proline iminopeptidase